MVLVKKYKGKKPLGRIRCIGRDNIKTDSLRNRLEGRGVDRYGSGWGKKSGLCKNGSEFLGCVQNGKFLTT